MKTATSQNPRVSVIMSVFNDGRYIREAVESVLGQTFTEFEFIIIDDGSTDGTADILESYDDDRIKIIRQENRGLTKALNRGLACARGEYIARQDADDISGLDRLSREVEFLDQNPDISLVGCWGKVIDEVEDVIRTLHFSTTSDDIAAELPCQNQFIHGSIMARKKVFESINGYREEFRYSQDYDLFLRLSVNYRLANISEELYTRRHSLAMISFKKQGLQQAYARLAQRMAKERMKTGVDSLDSGVPAERLLDYIKTGSIEADKARYHQDIINICLREGNVAKVRKESLALLKINRVQPRVYLYLLLTLGGASFTAATVRLWDKFRYGCGACKKV